MTVRFVPLPPKTIFPLGISWAFEEVLRTTSAEAGVSTSSIVNAIGVVAESSEIVWFAISLIVGRSLIDLTVTSNVSVTVPPSASWAVTVISAVPNWLAVGATTTVLFESLPEKTIFASGINAVFDDLPLRIRAEAVVSTSPIVKLCGEEAESSLKVRFAIGVIVGRSLTEFTMTMNVSDAVPPSASVTVTVIMEVPN